MSNRRFWRGNQRGNFRGRGGRGNRSNGYFDSYRHDFNEQNQNFGRNNFQNNQNFKRSNVVTKRLSEDEIGVTEYINDHEGFNGIIKSRYSDFQVSEINLNGEIAKLTNLEPPELPKDKDIDEDEDLVLNKYNLEILPMETWDDINKLAIAKNACTDKVQIDVTGMPKEHRTRIHDAVKKAFGKGIVGSTVTVDDKKYVCFEKFRKGVRIDKRVKWLWPAEYVYFIVHKENCDTMEAASRIAERLRITLRPAVLGYAGTKDRRAVTSQWFSLRKVEPRRIHAACRELRDIHVGNYAFAHANLRLGMLSGNRFRIVLRNVTASDECVAAACELLQRNGFINYYGLQRFGSRVETPTYRVGLQLFQGKLKEAIESILEERGGPLHSVLRAFRSGGAAAAADAWRSAPRTTTARFPIELRLLRALADNPNDFAGAINRIPRNARLLYVHSYQSLIWNKVASLRLRRFGPRPAVGDVVPLTQTQINEEAEDAEESENEDGSDNEMDTDTYKQNDNTPDEEPTTEASPSKPKKKGSQPMVIKEVPVKILTQEDVDKGTYTLFDVVLPLPGYIIKYPPNMLDYYEELLTKDGLTLQMKNKIKSLSSCGAYRHLIVRPRDMSWRTARYSDPHADLLSSDLDEMRARNRTAELPDGLYKAVIVTMSLPTSSYATMMLRELLKVDTASDNQALQNNYHKVKARSKASESDQNAVEKNDGSDNPTKAKQGDSPADAQQGDNATDANQSDNCTEAKLGDNPTDAKQGDDSSTDTKQGDNSTDEKQGDKPSGENQSDKDHTQNDSDSTNQDGGNRAEKRKMAANDDVSPKKIKQDP